MDGTGDRIVIDTEPTVKCKRDFHYFAATHRPNFKQLFARVGPKGADAMTIADQKTDHGLIHVGIESSRDFHSNGRAGINDFHATMSGISQLSHHNLSTSISVTISKRKGLE